MGKLFKFVFQLVVTVGLFFVFTSAIIMLDGSTDQGRAADVGIVLIGQPLSGTDTKQAVLDHAAKLYAANAFPAVIVASSYPNSEQPAAMASYLSAHGVNGDSIIKVTRGHTLQDIGKGALEQMKAHDMKTAIIVSDYYRITPLKLALYHGGLTQIGKSHSGSVSADDIPQIFDATMDFYKYVLDVFIIPTAEKVRDEAKTATQTMKSEADKAGTKIDKGLDNMPR